MTFIKRVGSAADLGTDWDALANSYCQRREFLTHCELHEPCDQRYWLMYDQGRLLAGVVVYTMPLDLLTYVGLPSPVKMHIAGIPASPSPGGLIGKQRHVDQLAMELSHLETGFLLLLSLDTPVTGGGFASGRTLPTVTLNRSLTSLSDYKQALRSDYRRRFHKITSKFADVSRVIAPCSEFTPTMYKSYEAVWQRSDVKLEKLSFSFFKELPSSFTLSSFYHEELLLGWHITLRDTPTFVFFMGGINYDLKERFDTFFNIIVDVLAQGLDAGFTKFDFGQTAEIPKTRLGGSLKPKFMCGRHSSRPLNLLLHLFGKNLEYKRQVPPVRVFRNER